MPVLGWAFTHLHWLVPNIHAEDFEELEDELKDELEDKLLADELVDKL